MKREMAKQLEVFEKDKAELKKIVTEQDVDMEILQEAATGNW